MKDNYSEMNVDMEQILFSKKYEDLTAEELNEIKDFVSSKEEFNIMKNTLMNVKNSFGIEEEIEPVDSAKENLMKMFEQKHGKVIPMNKPRPFYLNPIFQIGVAAAVVLGIIFFYPKGETESLTAMKESKEEAPADKDETKSSETAPAEETTEAVEEEVLVDELAEESSVADEKVATVKEDLMAEEKTVTSKNVVSPNSFTEFEKKENNLRSEDKDGKDLAELESDAVRSSSKKEKAKAEEAIVTNASPTTVTTSNSVPAGNGAISGGFAFADDATVDNSSKKKADSDKGGKSTHTNTAGGYYMQPSKPAADLKQGVSLKDEPALADFLFTAL